jgi:hypothetical protein
MDGSCDLSRGRDSEKIGPIFMSPSFVNATGSVVVVLHHGLPDYQGSRKETLYLFIFIFIYSS